MNPAVRRYAISDRNYGEPELASPIEQARLLAAEGVEFYQLREKDLAPVELADLARHVLQALAGTATRLLLNSRADVAIATGAHGVHLPSSPVELTPSQVHRLFALAGRPAPVVSFSCHSLEDVSRVREQPLAAILFGPVFGKTVGRERVVEGLELECLRKACLLAAPVPVFALGGVNGANASLCHEAGAAGIAGIRMFQRFGADGRATAVPSRDSNGG